MSLSDTQTGRERASGTAERHRWPGMQAAREHSRRAAPPRAAAFWLVAGVLCLLFFAAGAPAPLYGAYRGPPRCSAAPPAPALGLLPPGPRRPPLGFVAGSDVLGRRPRVLARPPA